MTSFLFYLFKCNVNVLSMLRSNTNQKQFAKKKEMEEGKHFITQFIIIARTKLKTIRTHKRFCYPFSLAWYYNMPTV